MRALFRRHLNFIAWAVVFTLLGLGIYRVETLNNQHATQICKAVVQTRHDNREVWERVRSYLLAQTPENRVDNLNTFIDAVLVAIPELECVNHRPVERSTT